MRIGGFQQFSLIDYPGKMAAIVFTQGCNFRCGYCYNSQLACPKLFEEPLDESMVLEFLESRKGRLEGVVVTGGEPTIQQGLADFLRQLKSMHYAVKLDTNGSNPDVLASVIERKLVDFIAMDLKTSPANYGKAVGIKIDFDRIKSSIDLIINSGLRHQFRTTLVRPLCSEEDLKEIQNLIGASRQYVLQLFMPSSKIIDQSLLAQPQYTLNEVQHLRLLFQRGF
ncbi:MAG: anaerobic ribonucleoside-triphosphate reductase activating protein [Candidatus Omnitrophica bacterium]|nr:anaerobic ribonucleoside-triphosphate reductase activating protein [Candidatus Omnitrophota bacterium]MDE2214959.1 anaerobic ribonucleoside-triphosphate reductase activating protein [Candidatus Omnitrophota bacterium]MDE2230898.1 anaerobic ribonucleoside-triphosphate reductase activating protein [Candidatus Omnitrophota bacterium]